MLAKIYHSSVTGAKREGKRKGKVDGKGKVLENYQELRVYHSGGKS